MDVIARQALSKLLGKAERQKIKSGNGPTPSLKFSAASLPAYNAPLTRERLNEIHAELREGERSGAITIDWDRRAGDDGQIMRIRLRDATKLAEYLGEQPRWEILAAAEAAIAPWRGQWRVDDVWTRWRLDKGVRGLKAERYSLLVDACRVLERLPDNQDVPVRRLSAVLFKDTKRIERDLPAMLDELTRTSDLLTSESQLVLQRLGLVKHPQPLLIAGRVRIRMDGEASALLHRPYTGVAPDHFLGLADGPPGHVLTIENLATFNEVARSLTDADDAVVIYTGGMPSPAVRQATRALIADCDDQTCFWHWGDIDIGGLRIALTIRAELGDKAALKPWQMDPSALPSEALTPGAAENVVRQMTALARLLGWPEVESGIRRTRATVEQEVLEPRRPF